MDKGKIREHICAFIIFAGCIITVVLLLTKFKPNDGTADMGDNSEMVYTTTIGAGSTTSNNIAALTYWNRDTSLIYGRANHEAVLLANGKVMVAGGLLNSSTATKTCEFYSSSTGWQLGAMMNYPRFYSTLTSFADKTKVLAAGSADSPSQQTAEVYDSINDNWTSTATNMLSARFAHAAVLLENEQILIMGGIDSFGHVTPSTELFIPSSESFIKGNDMNIGRALFTSTVLNDGSTVLITGGGDKYGHMISIAELYISDSWTFINKKMMQPRAYHAAILLQDGTVLIAGGGNGIFVSYSTAEIYNPTTRTFTRVGSMAYRRALFTLTLLPTGKVLATGGVDWITNTYPVICELYDPITQTWSNTEVLNTGRYFHQSVLLNDSVLTIGGFNMNHNQSATCEKYKF